MGASQRQDLSGDRSKYRRTCLSNVLYKLFTTINLLCISRTSDVAKQVEHAEFRQPNFCMDHIQLVCRCCLPLVLIFMDYQEANSVETIAINPLYPC